MKVILLCLVVLFKAPLLASDFDLTSLNADTRTGDGYHLASLAIDGEREKIKGLVGVFHPIASRVVRTELSKLGKISYRMIEIFAKDHFNRYTDIVRNMLELIESPSDIQTWCLAEMLRNMSSYLDFNLLNRTVLLVKTLMPSDPTGVSRLHVLNYFRIFLGKGFSLKGFQEFYKSFSAQSSEAKNQAIVIEALLNVHSSHWEEFFTFSQKMIDTLRFNQDEYSRIIFALSGVYLQTTDGDDSKIKDEIDALSEKTFGNIMTVLKPYRLKQRIES